MTTLTNQEVLAELYYTAKAIKYVTGVTPLHWRPVSYHDNVVYIYIFFNIKNLGFGRSR
jgi:hypothetical protein